MTAQEQYIKEMWQTARTVPLGRVLPSVLLAQSAVESGWGSSGVCKAANNYFGVTKGSWTGETYKASTGYTFRKYASKRQSVKDYIKILHASYKHVILARNYTDQAIALNNSAYSGGDANYGAKIINIIEKYNLKKYDTYYKLQLAGIGIAAILLIILSIYILKH